MYRVPARLVPVCVFNGSRNRGTEEGSVRQGLNELQYYNSAGCEQTGCAVVCRLFPSYSESGLSLGVADLIVLAKVV